MPMMPPPVRYRPAGAAPSAAFAPYTWISPLTASASCLASGLQARPSACGSLELTWRGAADGTGLAWVGVAAGGGADPLVAGEGEATGVATLIGSITGPWSGSEMAASVPSALIAIGPSSGPGDRGNGFSTAAAAFSQYHAPVPNTRTAINPSGPGAAPSVQRAAS